MSERELREDCWYDSHGDMRCVHCGVYKADMRPLYGCQPHRASCPLAADPDVVAVARKIVDEVCKGTLSPEQVWAVGLIKRWMEETFGFRLTTDGYEWTEEATDE